MATFSSDVEDESILSSIFKDLFPDSWRSNPDFSQYLSDLSSYGVEKLYREPERLAEEKTQILEQTQDLAFHNYKTFIETAECSREIFQDFQIIESHVGGMLEKLPELAEACQTFMKQASNINASRRMNNVTLARNTQLLEILEMPQLMDTCVRNGYYEEALELASHVRRLEKKHSGIPIIMRIVEDIKACSQLMLRQLIQQLRSNVQLPACLKVIGYLRRMDVFSEAELRIKFLQARDAWFQSILAGIPNDDPYYHVTKTIEASRVHLFDIMTQYRAVFSDDDSMLSTHKHSAHHLANLFHGWLIQRISQFLNVLETDLQRGMGSRLDSLLGQCMYFGLSFSRVGADFRGLLVPIFQRAALASFRQAVDDADRRYDEEMQSFTLLGNQHALPSSAYSLASQGTGNLQPPISLLEFQPLALYCNALLTAFNDLRLCAPLSLACDVAGVVQKSLSEMAEIIVGYHRSEETTFNATERERFREMCRIYAEELVPYMQRCLHALFPPTLIAQTLGLSVAQLNKLGSSIGGLDTESIIEPLNFLLPKKEPPPASVNAEISTDQDSEPPETTEVNAEEISQSVDAAAQKAEEISQSVDAATLNELIKPEVKEADSDQLEKQAIINSSPEIVVSNADSADANNDSEEKVSEYALEDQSKEIPGNSLDLNSETGQGDSSEKKSSDMFGGNG